MNMQHVVKINGQIHEIKSSENTKLVLNQGKRWAVADMEQKKLVHKHCLSGRFMSEKIK